MPYTEEQLEDYREWLDRVEHQQRITGKDIQTKKQLQAILKDFQGYTAPGKQKRALWGITKPIMPNNRPYYTNNSQYQKTCSPASELN